MIKLSIIIVNWNVKELLKKCLKSIFGTLVNLDFEVIVVDNNSSDGSVNMIKKKFPAVKLIINNKNVGFSKANNQAIKKSNSPYTLLLNPDTIIHLDALEILANFLDEHKDVAVVGPKVLNEDGSIQHECARHFPTPLSEFFVLTGLYKKFPKNKWFGYYLMNYWDHNDAREVDCISGSCMMIRKDILDKIGLLDEKFFMYGEDVDLCYRIKQVDYKIWYLPEATITHFAGKSSEKNANYMLYESCKSMEFFFKKNCGKKFTREYRIAVVIAILPIFLAASILFFINYRDKSRWSHILKKSKSLLLWALNLNNFT